VWDLEKGKEMLVLRAYEITSLVLSQDGKRLVSGSRYKGGRYQVEGENGVSCTVVVER
jgi:hypothetical protein